MSEDARQSEAQGAVFDPLAQGVITDWGRVVTIVYVLIFIALAAIFSWIGYSMYAQHRIRAAVAAIHRSDDPAVIEAAKQTLMAVHPNAVLYIVQEVKRADEPDRARIEFVYADYDALQEALAKDFDEPALREYYDEHIDRYVRQVAEGAGVEPQPFEEARDQVAVELAADVARGQARDRIAQAAAALAEAAGEPDFKAVAQRLDLGYAETGMLSRKEAQDDKLTRPFAVAPAFIDTVFPPPLDPPVEPFKVSDITEAPTGRFIFRVLETETSRDERARISGVLVPVLEHHIAQGARYWRHDVNDIVTMLGDLEPQVRADAARSLPLIGSQCTRMLLDNVERIKVHFLMAVGRVETRDEDKLLLLTAQNDLARRESVRLLADPVFVEPDPTRPGMVITTGEIIDILDKYLGDPVVADEVGTTLQTLYQRRADER